MSSTAPPVPSSSSAENGTSVDPTTLTTAPVSTLRVGQAPTQSEIVPASGQLNLPDPYMKKQFIHIAAFTWNTTQLPGTLLFSTPIHPSRGNWFLQTITAPYNCWRGGLDYSFKIAGTGFHAGALAFVRLPPNVKPQDLTSPADFTVFEYQILDPKTLGMESYSIMDQVPLNYHYNPLNLDDPNSFGGYFACYVLLSLATSSTGLNQVGVEILNKASDDLVFSQPRPLLTETIVTNYTEYEDILPRHTTFLCPEDWNAAFWLETQPTLPQATDYQVATTCRLNGSPNLYTYREIHNPLIQKRGATIQGALYESPFPDDFGLGDAWTAVTLRASRTPATFNVTGATSNSTNYDTNATWPTSSSFTREVVNSSVIYFNKFEVDPAPTFTFTPNSNETILLFRSKNNVPSGFAAAEEHRRAQTDHVYRLLQRLAQRFSWSPNDALLFTMIHIDSALPILYVKLYPEGVMTVAHTAVVTRFPISDYQFRFYSVTNRNTAVPVPSTSMKNNLAVVTAQYMYEKLLSQQRFRDDEIERLHERLNAL